MLGKIEITRGKEQRIFWVLFGLSTVLGLIGFGISDATTNWLDVLTHTIGLFFFAWTNDDNIYVNLAQLLAIFTTLLGVGILFFRDAINRLLLKTIQRKEYNLLVGLGQQNKILLDNEKRYIIIEEDNKHKDIERLKNSTQGIIVGNYWDSIRQLKLHNLQHAIISTGNDRQNIALCKYILEYSEGKKTQTIHTQITNRDLNALFQQNIIKQPSKDISVITYSLYENMAKQLFREHSILGEYQSIVENRHEYNMAIVGSSPLAIELIYHIALLAHLPNQNKLKLYCINRDAQKFCSRVEMLFSNISAIPHIEILPVELDSQSIEFYRDEIWQRSNLTNIYIATEDEEQNLNIAINLQDTTYIQAIAKEELQTKIHFAIYHNLGLSQEIDSNKEAFANFYSFASVADASTHEIVIDEELDILAQRINYDYDGNQDEDEKLMHEKWLKLDPHKRSSNKAQAIHIDTKLLSLGLKRVKSTKSVESLKAENQKIFYDKLTGDSSFELDLANFSVDEFPKDFDRSMIDRLARAEHNRWDAFHYLNGWSYNQKRNDKAKEHDCLKPIEEFDSTKLQETYRWDLASVYYIPIYLAKSGYGVESIAT